jgi:hypothetical protein
MRPLRLTLLLGVIAAAVAAASAFAAAPSSSTPPVAHAAGGDVTTVIYPAIVNTRLVRAQTALDAATQYHDMGDDANAAKALAGVRANVSKAWTADKYLIQNSPPPVAAEAGLRVTKPKSKAHASGAPVGAVSPYADYFATTSAVLALDHTVATTAMSMLDTASATALPAINSAVFGALNARDSAIAFIHTIPVPAAAAGHKASAHASGAPVVADWSTTMQPITFDTADELLQIKGLQAGGGTASRSRLLTLAQTQITKTTATVNKDWPPTPPEA